MIWTNLETLPMTWWWLSTALLGLIVGSFLNVVIWRLPRRLQAQWRHTAADLLEVTEDSALPPGLVTPRSHCPLCQHPIAWYDNLPVLSWFLLRARCRHCGARIGLRYPLVELITALLSVIVILVLGVTAQGLAGLVLLWTLIALTGIDLEHQLLPDQLTLPLLWAGLLLSVFEVFVPADEAIWGAAVGYLSLWVIYHGHRLLTGKEGLGHGDFKLLAALGAWVGIMMLPILILLASVSGVLLGGAWLLLRGHGRSQPIPFGPFLALAGLMCVLFGEQWLAWWLA